MAKVEAEMKAQLMQVFQGCQFTIPSLDWTLWESDQVKIISNDWKIGMKKDDEKGKLGVKLRYMGPDDKVELYKFQFEIGKKNPVNDQMKGTLKFESGKALGFDEFITLADLKKKFEEDGALHVYFSCTAYATSVNKQIEDRINQLTAERNSLHRSLNSLSMSDKDAAALTEQIATQPEIVKQYEAFKNDSKTLIFELEGEFKDEFFSLLENLSTRVQRQAEKKYTRQATDIIKLLGLTEANLGTVSLAMKQIVRSTYKFDPENLSGEDLQVITDIIKETKLKDKAGALKWGKFVWALTQYQFGNPNVFVNWEAIGNKVAFDLFRHKSIERKLQKGAECRILIPMLTTRQDLKISHSEDSDDEKSKEKDKKAEETDREPLSFALVMG